MVVEESFCWVRDFEVTAAVEGGGLDDEEEAGRRCGVDVCESASESESSSQAMFSSGERAAPNEE